MAILPLTALVIYFTPVVPITASWRRTSGKRTVISLWLVTISFAWMVAAIFTPALLAGYYSSPRFAIIGVNAVVMLLCAVAGFRSPSTGSKLTGVAALMVAGIWLFIYAINTTV